MVPGGSPAAAAGRIIQLLSDPAGARAMGEKGLAWVDREWRWELAAGRLADLLSALAARPRLLSVTALARLA